MLISSAAIASGVVSMLSTLGKSGSPTPLLLASYVESNTLVFRSRFSARGTVSEVSNGVIHGFRVLSSVAIVVPVMTGRKFAMKRRAKRMTNENRIEMGNSAQVLRRHNSLYSSHLSKTSSCPYHRKIQIFRDYP